MMMKYNLVINDGIWEIKVGRLYYANNICCDGDNDEAERKMLMMMITVMANDVWC